MQSVASEMNLSETAFARAPRRAGYGLRWFTPVAEVGLCGHATLASAHVLYEAGLAEPAGRSGSISVSGPLTARHEDGLLVLDFPARPAGRRRPRPGCWPRSGWTARSGRARPRTTSWWSWAARRRSPGCARTPWRWPDTGTRGVIVTAPASRPGADFVSRFFAPGVGIAEDPVTGSAHCTLAPYWAAATRPDRAHRLPGFGAGRDGRGAAGGGTGAAGRPRRHRVLWPAERRRAPPAGRRSAADRVTLHAARVGRRVQEPAGPGDGADPPERPRGPHRHPVPALTQPGDHVPAHPLLHRHRPAGTDSRGWNEDGKWLVWKAGASIASCRFMPNCTWLRKNDSDHWSCWSPPGVPNAR